MGKIVHRVEGPLVPGAMMFRMQNAVHDGIPQIQIGGSHVDLRAQRARPVRKFTGTHALKQGNVFLNTPVTERTLATRFRKRTAMTADLITGKITYKCIALADQLQSPFKQLAEVV